MADLERSTTVGVDAGSAFAYLADPANVAEWVGPITHVETTAVEGTLEGSGDAGDAATGTRFLADAAERRVEWGTPGGGYWGWATASPVTAGIATVTLHLHVRDEADAVAVGRVLDDALASLRRALIRR